MEYRKVNIKDVWEVIWRILLFMAVILTSAVYMAENELIIYWFLILIFLTAWLVKWHCEYFAYECDKCGHKQQIDFLKEFYTINLISRKYLKCEKCKKWTRAKLLVKD